MTNEAVAIQRAYYAATAQSYDQAHDADEEHHGYSLAEQFMLSVAQFLNVQSILDVGAGTGRVLLKIKKEMPDVDAIGIEPSPELRSVGYANGLLPAELREGDATHLAFDDGSFDLVCEFGVLHHMATPSRAVSEMLRVARKAMFIVDNNNFAVGSKYVRMLKQSIAAVRNLPARGTDQDERQTLFDHRKRRASLPLLRVRRLQTDRKSLPIGAHAQYHGCRTESLPQRASRSLARHQTLGQWRLADAPVWWGLLVSSCVKPAEESSNW